LREGLQCEVAYARYGTDNRSLVLDLSLQDMGLRSVNVYCANDPVERNRFLQGLENRLLVPRTVILAGDFNFVENPLFDKVGGDPTKGNSSHPVYNAIRVNCDLVDAFRALKPQSRELDHRDSQSRLDRIYIAESILTNIESVRHVRTLLSDHDAVYLTLAFSPRTAHGKSFWKCNAFIIAVPHVQADSILQWRLATETVQDSKRGVE